MNDQNSIVVSSVAAWLEAGDRVCLATVVSTWGASPRPPGSLFAYNLATKTQVGSLSGGCIEDALIEGFSIAGLPALPESKVYGDSPGDQERFELPCGGTMSLLLEPLTVERHLNHFKELNQAIKGRTLTQRQVCLKSGDSSNTVVDHSAINSRERVALCSDSFFHIIGPAYQVLVVGVGEVARNLIDALKPLGFHVELCDARESSILRYSANLWDVPLHVCLPDDLINERFSDQFSAIVALAHDPRVDDLAVMAGLRRECFFVGAMGSAKTSQNRFDRLRSLGFNETELDTLHAPVGLPISSKMPAEIAVSITAQLIQERYKISDEIKQTSLLCTS